MQWKQILIEHYSAPLDKTFRQFRNGATLFFTGMLVIYCAHQLLQPSLQQELAVLAGLMLLGIGFLTAILAQMRMIIGRFVQFFRK